MINKPLIFSFLIVLLTVQSFYGQKQDKKIDEARLLVETYIEASKFKSGINDESIDHFKECFDKSANIVFDIPFKNTAIINSDIERISKDVRQQPDVINVFGKLVPLDMYLEILERETEREGFELDVLNYSDSINLKIDISRINNDTIKFEVEKKFASTKWSSARTVKYIVCIGFKKDENYKAYIQSIYPNDESTAQKKDIVIILVDASKKSNEPGYLLSDIGFRFKVNFKEPINNISVPGTTNTEGQKRFEKIAINSSEIDFDSIMNNNKSRVFYSRPADWDNGKKVSQQPPGGFVVGLTPYKLYGISYSIFLSGGVFIPENVNMRNFSAESSFDSETGFKYGGGITSTYFFNAHQLLKKPEAWLYGLGLGLSADYRQADVNSDGFQQNDYQFTDNMNDSCHILFTGKAYSGNNDMLSITVPVFMEFNKYSINKKFSFSVKAGVNLSFPVSGKYEAAGTFSRWGYYDDLNSLPITDDRIYNYFTDSLISYSGSIKYNTLIGEGFIKLNGLFKIFKNPFNSLELGLIFSMPFTSSTSYKYPEGGLQDFQGYWINTGNNEYHSTAYSTDNRIYRYYIGISVGINFTRFNIDGR